VSGRDVGIPSGHVTTEAGNVMSDPLGQVLAERYRIEAPLGEGGIGRVYSGTHLKLGRRVAVKVLHDAYRENDALNKRFEREALALSALSHPQVVPVIDYGIDGGLAYIVMELVDGRDLAAILREGRLAPARAMTLMRQLLRALVYAHHNRVIHRDLKPANIMVRWLPDGAEHIHVLDFGLAKFLSDDQATNLTRSGHVLGTPAYMAPEQASGDATDERTDVYAAGLIFFEMLVGRGPFSEASASDRLRRQLTEPPPRLSECKLELPEGEMFDAFIRTSLAIRKTDRYADADAMLAAFSELPALDLVAQSDSVATRKTLTSAHRARRSSLATLGPALLTGVLGFGAGALAFRSSDAPPMAEVVAEVAADLGQAVVEVSTAIPVARVEELPGDPWSAPVPGELAPLKRQIDRGAMPSPKAMAPIFAYARANPTDPRPNLLFAQTYFDRGWHKDAITHAGLAFEKDPAARGAPRLLADLIEMTGDSSRADDAAAALERIFGAIALPALEARIERERDAEVRGRLEAAAKQIRQRR
jgi:eukaryotic-like serine/threonine-protein kinase